MTTYLVVYGETPEDRLAVHVFDTRIAAVAAAASSIVPRVGAGKRDGGVAVVVETEADVTFSTKTIAAICRGLIGSGPKSFETREKAIKRLMAVLADHAVAQSTTEEKNVSKTENPTTTANGEAAPVDAKLRHKYGDDAKITVLVETNPKKAGSASHTRFEKYRTGMTVPEALAAGVLRADLSWDTNKGFIRVE